jgi:hypothetical protein
MNDLWHSLIVPIVYASIFVMNIVTGVMSWRSRISVRRTWADADRIRTEGIKARIEANEKLAEARRIMGTQPRYGEFAD